MRFALFVWTAFSILVPASAVAIYLRNGVDGVNLFIQQWPLSNLAVTLESVALTWLCFGAILFLIYKNRINSSNLIFVSGFFLVVLVYLNILRERFRYGDYQYYLEAASALYNNQPLPDSYLYLPLWATLLQFIAPLGDTGMLAILWFIKRIGNSNPQPTANDKRWARTRQAPLCANLHPAIA